MLSSYIILCFKKSCAGFFKQLATAYGLFTTPIAIFIVNKIYESIPGAYFLQTNLIKNITYFFMTLLFIWIFRLLFWAPYCLWNSRRLDDLDLNHLLNGKFIGNRFYPRCPDLIICQIENENLKDLKNKFLEIEIHAPQNCFAYIKFHISRDRGPRGFRLYTINEHGKDVEIKDIHEVHKIFVNEDFKFSIKLACDPDYNLEEHVTSITGFSGGWVKI